jgi:hypothetical protein
MKISQTGSSPSFSLLGDETLLKEVNLQRWDAYMTSRRVVLFHDIGFGPKHKIMEANHSDFESAVEKKDIPWGLYGIAGLFTALFMAPMIFMDKYNFLTGAPYWAYIGSPILFLIGIYIVGNAFFRPTNLVVKLKNLERTFSIPIDLKDFFTELAAHK